MKITGDSTEVFSGIGFAVVICALCLGIGSCNYIGDKGLAKLVEAKANAKLIEAQAKQIEEQIKNPETEIEKAINNK